MISSCQYNMFNFKNPQTKGLDLIQFLSSIDIDAVRHTASFAALQFKGFLFVRVLTWILVNHNSIIISQRLSNVWRIRWVSKLTRILPNYRQAASCFLHVQILFSRHGLRGKVENEASHRVLMLYATYNPAMCHLATFNEAKLYKTFASLLSSL